MTARRAGRLLVAATAVVCCLVPLVTSAVHVGRGWMPVSDTAIIVTRARDVFTGATPLLGQPSTAGASVGEQVHHPGPLEYWALAVGQQVADRPLTGLVVTAVVNAAAVLAALWWAWRLAGPGGLALAAAVLTTLLWSLRGEVLVDPLNPAAAVVPLGAFLVSLVAVLDGRRWAATTAVLAGSYAAQAHLTVTVLVAVAATVAAVIGAARWWRGGDDRRAALRRTRRPAAVAAVVLAACWSGPIVDVVVNDGGNVAALAETTGALPPREGALGAAVDSTVVALAPRPVWAQAGADVPALLARPGTGDRAAVAGLWLVGAAAAWHGRRRTAAPALALAVATAVLVAGTGLLSRVPGSFFNVFQPGNYFWLWPAGALLWAAVAGGAGAVVVEWAGAHRAVRVAAVGLPLAVAAAVAAAAVATPSHRIVQRGGAEHVRALGAELARTLDRSATYGLDLSYDLVEQVVDTGVLAELERRGFDVRVAEELAPSFGPRRATGLEGTDGTLVVDLGTVPPPPPRPDARLVAEYRPPPAVRAGLAAAEDAVAARIERSGGLDWIVYPALGVSPGSTDAFVRGEFLGLAEIGLLSRAVASWPETRALAAARAAAVEHAAVHLLPAPSATLSR